MFFDEQNSEKASIHNMNDTWWGKVIDFFGGELLVNNSWSGSRVRSRRKNSFPSGCSDERTSYLHIDGSHPNANGMNTLATLVIKEMTAGDSENFIN